MTRQGLNDHVNRVARAVFRQHGYRVEAVSMIRSRDDEFMCIVETHPASVAQTIEFLMAKDNQAVDVTRIHLGNQANMAGFPQHPAVRIYLRWAHPYPAGR